MSFLHLCQIILFKIYSVEWDENHILKSIEQKPNRNLNRTRKIAGSKVLITNIFPVILWEILTVASLILDVRKITKLDVKNESMKK